MNAVAEKADKEMRLWGDDNIFYLFIFVFYESCDGDSEVSRYRGSVSN